MQLALAVIRHDGGTQPRAETDSVAIEEYARAMLEGAVFPPLTVYYDGQDYWLASGFHRWWAAAGAGFEEIECDVQQGTQRDAILCSVGENAEHGMRRTNGDKRRAVRKLLEDAEWRQWSDREIARQAKVDVSLVKDIRPEIVSADSTPILRKVERGGTTYTMQTGGSGTVKREPSSAAGPIRPPVGHREPEQRDRGVAIFEALNAIVNAWRTLPDPSVAAQEHLPLSPDEAFRIATWFTKLAGILRSRIERAS